MVLVLIGLMTGMVLPRLANFYSSLERALERDEIVAQVNRLGFLAYQAGQDFQLKHYPDNKAQLPLDLPENWVLEADPPIHYRHNGLCAGGQLILSYEQAQWVYVLTAPFCQLQADGS